MDLRYFLIDFPGGKMRSSIRLDTQAVAQQETMLRRSLLGCMIMLICFVALCFANIKVYQPAQQTAQTLKRLAEIKKLEDLKASNSKLEKDLRKIQRKLEVKNVEHQIASFEKN